MHMIKFGKIVSEGEDNSYDYGNVYFREKLSVGERLTIGPSSNHVNLMLSLAKTLPIQQFVILYVSLLSHTGKESGRYQSPFLESFSELEQFFLKFKQFFETDGRHHVWIGSPANNGTMVYDQHNVIFAYGDLNVYKELLDTNGFVNREFRFPAPHSHHYHTENIKYEEDLFNYFAWIYSPLQSEDGY
jgi:hypothetical protein